MKLAKRLMMRNGGQLTLGELSPDAWWSPWDASARVMDGTAISQLIDKSGNSRHATMTEASRPTLAGALAGFDGVDDYMNISVPQSRQSHIFCVVDTTALQTGWRVFMDRVTGSSPYPPALYFGRVSYNYMTSIYWGTTTVITEQIAMRNLRIQEFRLGLSSVGLRVNGGEELVNTISATITSTWNSLNAPNTYGQQAAFSLGDTLIFNRSLTTEERQIVEGVLAHSGDAELGVTTLRDGLPTGHPYKTTAP